jgi:hypothetical protein
VSGVAAYYAEHNDAGGCNSEDISGFHAEPRILRNASAIHTLVNRERNRSSFTLVSAATLKKVAIGFVGTNRFNCCCLPAPEVYGTLAIQGLNDRSQARSA